ncbi:MAG: OmpA family protein [Rikenellaceae bacterium]
MKEMIQKFRSLAMMLGVRRGVRSVVMLAVLLFGVGSVAAQGGGEVVERDSLLRRTTLYFHHNSLWVDIADLAEVNELCRVYRSNDNSRLKIEAWCDKTGTQEVNDRVSRQRAEGVRRYFIREGVQPKDITLVRGNGVDYDAATDSLARRSDVYLVVKVLKSVEPEVSFAPKFAAAEVVEATEVAKINEAVATISEPVEESIAEPTVAVAKDSVRVMTPDWVRKSREIDRARNFNREVNHKIRYAYKGEFVMGAAVSYGEVDSENSELMLVLDGIDANASLLSIKPFVGYFYKDNRCVGLRFAYSSLGGELGSATLDLGETNDISFDIPYVSLSSESYSCGIFHRSYVGLDRAGRAGLFAEIELMGCKSRGETAYEKSTDVIERSSSESISAELSFNPGVAVYIMPNVCTTLSFGFGGLTYKSIDQYDEKGNRTGGRISSKMSFKFNVTAINFGVNIHLWSKGNNSTKK